MIGKFLSKNRFFVPGIVLIGMFTLALVANLWQPVQTAQPDLSVPVTETETTTTPLPPYKPVTRPQAIKVPVEPVPQQVVIQFAQQTTEDERKEYVASIGGTVVESIDSLDTVVVNLPEELVDEPLPESPVVIGIEPDYFVSALDLIPDDPRYTEQWALPAIGVPAAWEQMPQDAPTVRVAVIDSGVCADHPDLAGRIETGWDFLEDDDIPQDDFGHGCAVSGVIAANINDGVGIAGVAPNAQIIPLRVLNASGVGSYSDVAAAIVYAADFGVQVINLSLGGSNPSTTLENAVNYAVDKGVIVVAAAGNNGMEGALYPAAYEPVIAVGSVDPNLQNSSFSNYGSQIDIWAPGRDILTTKQDGSYGLVSGTSFAAPYVAGAEIIAFLLNQEITKNGSFLSLPIKSDATLGTLETPTSQPPTAISVEIPTQSESRAIISDENFVSGEPRDQLSIEQFLNELENPLLKNDLEPIEGYKIASPSALAYLSEQYSVSPTILLTYGEINFGLLSEKQPYDSSVLSPWLRDSASQLSQGFYEYYYGKQKETFTLKNGDLVPLNLSNASTYALTKFYADQYTGTDDAWDSYIDVQLNIFSQTYEEYFGNLLSGNLNAAHPNETDLSSLALPTLLLPWPKGDTWYYTGGPHNFDGSGNYPLSGIDFQPAGYSGCSPNVASDRWIVASAEGKTVDYQENWLKLDHDKDGNVSTGWLTVYGHIANRIGNNQTVTTGQNLGNPSCLGGTATGVHLHFGIKYQNVWQPIAGTVISGWTVQNGQVAYHGYMTKSGSSQRESCYRPGGTSNCSSAAVTSDNGGSSGGGGTTPARCDAIKNQNGVNLSKETECNGTLLTYTSSTSVNLTDVNWNDIVRSIQIGPNYSVKVWADINQNGASRCLKRSDTNGAYAFWDLYKDYYDNSSTRIWSSAGAGSNITSIKVYTNENCTEPAALVDNATFIGQSAYPTVDPGQNFSIYFEVRNSGTSTWQPGSYWLQNLETPMGASSKQGLSSSVGPNGTKRWDINLTAPTTPGTYYTKWMVNHNGTNFGPYMYIIVIVRQPSCSGFASEVRLYDQTGCQSSAAKVTNGGTGLWDISSSFNDRAKSVEVPLGYSVRLYKDNSESSPSVCIEDSDSDLRNNSFSDGSAVASSTRGETTWVRIYNQNGCPATAPVTPSNLRQTGATLNSLTISWDDVTNETGYKIYEWNGSTFVYLASVGANQTSYTDTRFGCGGDEFYEVSAYNNVGESGHTGWVHAYTQTCPTVANDDFSNATAISGVPYTNTQTTAYATEANDDPVLNCSGFTEKKYNTVWYRYVPNASGTLTVNTFDSEYDTVLGIWTGTRGALAQQGCNDDINGGQQSQLQISVNSGTTYFIEIAGFSSGSEGLLSLSVNLDAKPNPPTLVSPALMEAFSSRTVSFSWNASNSPNATGYIFRISQSADSTVQPWLVSTTFNALSYQYTLPNDGYYYWHVQTISPTQNSNWVSRIFSVDTVSPTVSITSPGSASFLSTNQITIHATASDSTSGLNTLQFFVGYDPVAETEALGDKELTRSYAPKPGDPNNPNSPNVQENGIIGQAWDWLEIGWDSNGLDGWSMTWDASSAPDQSDVAFFIYAYDYVGNYQGTAVWATVLDRTPSTSAINTLPVYSPPTFQVSWQGTDNISGIHNFDVQVQDNGGSWVNWQTGVTNTTANYSGIVGHTYGFRVRSHDNAGNIENWLDEAETETILVVPPSNDNFSSPALITTVPFTSSIDVRGATTASNDPTSTCGSGKNSNSVWFKYIAPTNGLLEVDTWGSDYDTVIAVWRGSISNLVLVDCNDDLYGYMEAWLEGTPVTAGTTYYIEVMDYSNLGGGYLELYVNFAQSVSNDDFNSPIVINDYRYSVTQVAQGATKASDDPELTACNRLPGQASVWYKYSIPIDGELTIDTKGSDYDTMLAVWTGTRGNLTAVGCNDDVGYVGDIWDQDSILTVPVTADTSYYIEVSTYDGMIDVNGASASELKSKTFKLDKRDTTANELQEELRNSDDTGMFASELEALKAEIDKGDATIVGLQGDRPGDDLSAQFWGGELKLNIDVDSPFLADVDVGIGGQSRGSYLLTSGQEKREYYDLSGGPMVVESKNGMDLVSAIRLQSYASNTLYSFVETMGVPSGLLSHKYYFPTYNNTWGPLNSQIRFGNLDADATTIRVTIGGIAVWEEEVPGLEERRLYFDVSGGPVIIESLDTTKKIVAAIRLQSYASGTLYSFSETMGIPDEYLSDTYYFPTYNNTWQPLNSQLRFGNLGTGKTEIRVTIGDSLTETYIVEPQQEMRLYYDVSDGPVIVESLDDDPLKGTTKQEVVAAIRLQSYGADTLYSFVETMGVPSGLLSHKYYFPTYNNTWGPLNSQIRFGNLSADPTTVRVTIGGSVVWEEEVPGLEERRLYFDVSGGPVIIESLDPGKKIVAAIRLQSMQSGTLYSFSETMGIPDEQMSDTYYFPTYNNTWAPLNSQLRFGVP